MLGTDDAALGETCRKRNGGHAWKKQATPNASGPTPPRASRLVASLSQDEKLLVGRVEAAGMLSISCRALDYLVANKQLLVRRIGTRVLIPITELRRFSRSDHPERLVG